VLEFLLDHHCSTEVCDADLWQPLHAAACWGHLEAVEVLSQNGADISAVTRSGETPFDITEDPEIKERLVELAEQRLRLSERTRTPRGRSASTRTHSIRRTSLRDKMKTTKKDVTEEGLMYAKTVNKTTSDNEDNELHKSKDIVDPNDVHIILPPSNYQKQVAVVNPIQQEMSKPSPKIKSSTSSIPIRPSRSNQDSRRQSSLEDNVSGSPVITSISKPNSGSPSQEPINIHVSVTINPAMVANNNSSSFHSPPGTLADLKRSRSQSRVSGSSNSVTNQPEPEPPVSINPRTQVTSSGKSGSSSGVTMDPRTAGSGSRQHRAVTGSSKSVSPGQGRHKFAASSAEVVGPPSKSGCCHIL